MTVQILFFGQTAAIAGKRFTDLSCSDGLIASDVISKVVLNYPGLRSTRLLFSVNQEYTTGDAIVRDGDELAIFTAVSGG